MGKMIRVNILNKGNFSGIQTPVYNMIMDESTYYFLKEVGFNIEISKPVEKAQPIPVQVVQKPTVIVEEKKEEVQDIIPAPTIKQDADESWASKDYYDEETLKCYTKKELGKILNHRGHFSSKTGKRDYFAPKIADDKPDLIRKILATNKNN